MVVTSRLAIEALILVLLIVLRAGFVKNRFPD
jgi:hypothetical protein